MNREQFGGGLPHDRGTGGPASAWGPSTSRSANSFIGDAARLVRAGILDAAERQKAKGVRQIEGVAEAGHQAARELEGELPEAAGYVHRAAGRVGSASSRLRERDTEDLLAAFNRFAERRPWTVLGGAALAGVALSRFLASLAVAPRIPGSRRSSLEVPAQPVMLIGLGLVLGAAASKWLPGDGRSGS